MSTPENTPGNTPNTVSENPYPNVPQKVNYPDIEIEVLDFWDKDNTFAASVDAREGGDNEYVFYDGPPFANGLPHYGHLLTGFVKDAIPRYQTMRGRKVQRRFGWDCHGLPAEMEVEKQLGVSGKLEIENMGVEVFNSACRSLVTQTTDAWQYYVRRQARWVDFDSAYRTMDIDYMESVLWAFKRLWEEGLIYQGERVLPYCWECETPLSNFETHLDDAYRDRQDPSVTVCFELSDDFRLLEELGLSDKSELLDEQSFPKLYILAWTTTPWTLPSNLALAVGPDIEYAVLEIGKEIDGDMANGCLECKRFIVASAASEYYESLGAKCLKKISGSSLIGCRYKPLFDFFANVANAFYVLGADFVTTEEGTGVVHIAPGFGEDDYLLCKANDIPVVCPVDHRGRFTFLVPPYEGMQVFEANQTIIEDLAAKNLLVSTQDYTHSYPHCWRSDTPLIYKAIGSWFLAVTKIKDKMLLLNDEINWIPEHIRQGAFGKWLAGARDWSISRNRFWGAPIPVWVSDNPDYPRIDVYGSLDELKADFSQADFATHSAGISPQDLHRPYVDSLVRPNPDDPSGKTMMRRVAEVLDCWFESGAMPFAQLHYPFENTTHFESHFPADFIVEYIGQARGWFYTLHILSTALFNRPPFKSCVAHGVVLGDDGRKLSKRLGNFPDPEKVFNTYGADAMRWFFLSSAILKGQDLVVDEQGIAEPIRNILNPIWNAWYFLSLYGNADNVRGQFRVDSPKVLDRYILAKVTSLLRQVTEFMDAYDTPKACAAIAAFLDALNNWYIRRSRDRFWSPRPKNLRLNETDLSSELSTADRHQEDDKQYAYNTLATVLEILCRITAPLLPLVSEAVYKGLTGARSVHLTDWPNPDLLLDDPELVRNMDLVRELCSAAHSIRKANQLRARLPLATLTFFSPQAQALVGYVDLIKNEVNVHNVVFEDDVSSVATTRLNINLPLLGPRLGPKTQQTITAIKSGNFHIQPDGSARVGEVLLKSSEYELVGIAKDERTSRVLADGQVVVLDLDVNKELLAEGLARDVVRLIQTARRDACLAVTDRIHLRLEVPADVSQALEVHKGYLADQTLAKTIQIETGQLTADISSTTERYELTDGRYIGITVQPA